MTDVQEKQISIQYFALLREQRGLSRESLRTDALTAQDLYEKLRTEHGFTLPPDRMRVIVNESFVEWEKPLSDGDDVVFVPPVAGG